jgi:predicted esterase YcpF (UPF0227 family)
MAKILLALHGFHSSPNSLKIQQMDAYLTQHFPEITLVCPQLPCLPEQMWETIKAIFEQHKTDQIAVMGSSLGGYLATKAASVYQTKTLLINPAVAPYRLLQCYAGMQTHPYTADNYLIDEDYMAHLKALEVTCLSDPQKYWVLLQEADQVLDYREAAEKYKQCKITCEAGGEHSFIGFDRYLSDIIQFLF